MKKNKNYGAIGHNSRYILVDKVPQVEPDLIKWAKWFEKADRHVAKDQISKDIRVLTVFLGIDHSFNYIFDSDNIIPILFETIIFGGEHDEYRERYATYEQAEAEHKIAVQIAKGEIEPDGV